MVALIKGGGPGRGNSSVAVIVTALFLALAALTMFAVGRRITQRTPAGPPQETAEARA
ncbi:hypothetical protein [Streptomyces sp. DASNCL29]|uniref:hypothetical protein n=1 Tax=Streptomyces sp. DASNCL29 TaxID=2583819 RepID=UPI0019D22FC5|nr:hypothetical protein [Streptomyces sp. DASNCL29]